MPLMERPLSFTSLPRERYVAESWFDREMKDVNTTNRQDIPLCERTQLGVRSRSYVPGPNSLKREPGIRYALAAYHRLLGETEMFEELTGRAC
jgi:hypothetical protein